MISSIKNLFLPPIQPIIFNDFSPNNTCISSLSSLKKLDVEPKSVDLLTISPQNQETIQQLLEELATTSVFNLACNSLKLIKTGTTLREEVHPYRFLLEVFLHPPSKKHFRKIYEERNHFFSGRNQIWNDFARNLGKTFLHHSENIPCYTSSFAQMVQMDCLDVESYLQKKDWEGLLTALQAIDDQ